MNTVTLVLPDQKPQLITPSKVICIGRNYVDHINELANEIPDEMVVFLKPNSSISDELNATHNDDTLHYEAELCFLYQGGKFTAVALGLDLTKREVQNKLKAKGLPWERSKAFDGSAVFSDFLSFDHKNFGLEGVELNCIYPNNINQLTLSLTINNSLKQQGGVSLMLVKPDEILSELQSFLTLVDGDVVMTGTPKGVGIINKGDNFQGKVFLHNDDVITNKPLLDCQWQAQ